MIVLAAPFPIAADLRLKRPERQRRTGHKKPKEKAPAKASAGNERKTSKKSFLFSIFDAVLQHERHIENINIYIISELEEKSMEPIHVTLKGVAEIDNFGMVKFNHDNAQDLRNIIIELMGMRNGVTENAAYESKGFLGTLTLVMTPMDIEPEVRGGVPEEDNEFDW